MALLLLVFLRVCRHSLSSSFYESMGFEVIGRKVDYPSAGKTALRMTRPAAVDEAVLRPSVMARTDRVQLLPRHESDSCSS